MHGTFRLSRAIALAGLLFTGPDLIRAQDWPQFRGPSRDGAVAPASVPKVWPASYAPAWRVEVGEGYSSPVVVNGKVFVHSRRDPRELVTALDLSTGKVLWQQSYAGDYQKNSYAVRMGKGPNATPLVAGGRLFTLGATGMLTAWDTQTGRRIWQNDYSKLVDFSKLFCGTSASPAMIDGAVVVQVGSDIHGGLIAALDPATGEPRWQWKGPGPGYVSPVALTAAGTPQIVTFTEKSILSLDARTGKELWTVPFPDQWHENIVNPVWTGGRLIVSGVRQGTHAYRIENAGGKWRAVEAWANPQVSMYMSSPVAADGLIYGLSDKRKGYFVALDAATGQVKWQTEGREGTNAAVLLTPAHIVYLNDAGDLSVVKRATHEVQRKYRLGLEGTWAIPVLLGANLLVKDATAVVRLAPL
jgi:outer membrane protein assembly factor BamB